MAVGAWLNVIGYFQGQDSSTGAVRVQAIVVWNAGAINLAKYEVAAARRLLSSTESRTDG